MKNIVGFLPLAILTSLLLADTLVAQDLYVGNNSSSVTETFTSGTNAYDNTYIGVTATDSNNTLSVLNAATVLTNVERVIVGLDGSRNNLTISSGAAVLAGSSVVVGDNGTLNSMVVSGPGSVLSNSFGGLYVGNSVLSRSNSLIISNGGTIEVAWMLNVGGENSSDNTMLVSGFGSQLKVTQEISVGGNGSHNSLSIGDGAEATSGGTIVVGYNSSSNALLITGSGSVLSNSARIFVGNESNASHNIMTVSDGSFVHAGWDFQIGVLANSAHNAVLVTGTNSAIRATDGLTVGGLGSSNSMTISNGGTVTSGSYIHIGSEAFGNSIAVSGMGSVLSNSAAGIHVGISSTNNSMTVANEGTVVSSKLTLGGQASGEGRLNVGSLSGTDAAGIIAIPVIEFGLGAGSINFNQTNTFTLTSTVLGNGTLNQLGSGTTIISNITSHTGGTAVSNGSLLVEGVISLSDVNVLAGGAIGGAGLLGGNLSLLAGASFVFSLTDTLLVNGSSVTFEDFGIDDLVGLTQDTPNGTYTLIDGSALMETNSMRNFGLDNAYAFSGSDKKAYFTEGSLQVTVVPEPSTYALLLLGGAASLWALKRRKR
jgi:T5SS/PEP-CTERM-associated repeat protein/autotransporter-associated beta strand protein